MKISNLEKNFSGFSLRIGEMNLTRGEIHGLIGPNGCGKTTAMKLIAGLIKADSGTIDYGGLTQRDITMAARKPYFLHDSVYRNLVYPLILRKIKPDSALVDHYLEIAGLKDLREQYAPSLSTGQQQKLSLIRALIFSPKFILIDEALSNLDIESASLFEQIILEHQQKEPVTWLVISHQLSHIQRLCSRVFFMYGGKVEAQGTAKEILLNPQNIHLQKYLRYETLEKGETYGIFEG